MGVLISFREWLHSYRHLGRKKHKFPYGSSHLFQRVASFLLENFKAGLSEAGLEFSSLSESGFIPTTSCLRYCQNVCPEVLISFREWLHSYCAAKEVVPQGIKVSSHLFQRVASFLLPGFSWCFVCNFCRFSSLSESGFIPTFFSSPLTWGLHFLVLISFREWLHSYNVWKKVLSIHVSMSSHLFQRVASFLLWRRQIW